MVARIFLTMTGLMYVGLALFCTILPEQASETVHLQMNGAGGRSELTTVYGGLIMGMAMVCLVPLFRPAYTKTSLLACLLLHAGMASFRVLSLILYAGALQQIWPLAAEEILFFVLSLAVWLTSSFDNHSAENRTPAES